MLLNITTGMEVILMFGCIVRGSTRAMPPRQMPLWVVSPKIMGHDDTGTAHVRLDQQVLVKVQAHPYSPALHRPVSGRFFSSTKTLRVEQPDESVADCPCKTEICWPCERGPVERHCQLGAQWGHLRGLVAAQLVQRRKQLGTGETSGPDGIQGEIDAGQREGGGVHFARSHGSGQGDSHNNGRCSFSKQIRRRDLAALREFSLCDVEDLCPAHHRHRHYRLGPAEERVPSVTCCCHGRRGHSRSQNAKGQVTRFL
jgi:hypothetical protein